MYKLLILILLLLGCSPNEEITDNNKKQTVGLFINEPSSFDGYTLFASFANKKTYLINNKGKRVHSWNIDRPASSVYLLPNGNLLHCGLFLHGPWERGMDFGNHGAIAKIEEYNWDGQLVWTYELSNEQYQLHHDIAPMPNGNILAIAWERLSAEEAISLGRDPKLLDPDENNEVWSEIIIEIEPDYVSGEGGSIVWQWRLADHLVQDFDPSKANYLGENGVFEHPERVNFNYVSTGPWRNNILADWVHFNAIDYNPDTDHIMLSAREFSEFWIIDHGITSQEAAGQDGDLLYRYGNPQTYHHGTRDNQQLFYQHNAHWIPEGLPGAGNILVFNNGADHPGGHDYSSVLELRPAKEYGKADILWSYAADEDSTFYSSIVSGAQRLSNGNTLINEGVNGRFFEVNPQGQIVWLYVNPIVRSGPLPQGKRIPVLRAIRIPGVMQNVTFRATRYGKEYPAFVGKDLTPKGLIEKDSA